VPSLSSLSIFDNGYHLIIDIAALAIDYWALRLVNSSKYKAYAKWLVYFVISDVFSLLFRICHIVEYGHFSFNSRYGLFLLDSMFSLTEHAAGVCSLLIMLRMFKDTANRFRSQQSETQFQPFTSPGDINAWPPPPT
jgi:hypothetical protein